MIRRVLPAIASLLLFAAGPAAGAAEPIEDRLIGPETFPDLVLTREGEMDELLGDSWEGNTWMRVWSDPGTGFVVVAAASELSDGGARAFLAGFQSSLPADSLSEHPEYSDVVMTTTVGASGEAFSGVGFATNNTGFGISAYGPDRLVLLDRAIEAQLALLDDPLHPQYVGLAEDYVPDDGYADAFRTGQVLAYVAMAMGAIWLWRRRRRKKRELAAPGDSDV